MKRDSEDISIKENSYKRRKLSKKRKTKTRNKNFQEKSNSNEKKFQLTFDENKIKIY